MRGGSGAALSGRAAEEAVERRYAARGGRVLARRWRCREGEIDLVVGMGEVLVFVEVKARRDARAAAEAITPAQTRRLAAAIARYLAAEAADGRDIRVDVALVDHAGTLEVIENALAFDDF